MGRFSLVLLLTILVAACDPVVTTNYVCPYLAKYSRATQEQALNELRALPKGSALRRFIGDYATLRDQVRACNGEKRK